MFRNYGTMAERALERRQKLRATLPARLADHELIRLIAAGSYGDVWLGRNELTGTYRGIKIVWLDAFDTPKPYEREFEAIVRYEPVSRSHPGLVHILQTGRLENGFYYIMELADDVRHGQNIDVATYEPATLQGVRNEALPVDQAIKIGISLTESLAALHGEGLIHRDIKPSNVIFVGGVPKLADMGLLAAISEANSIVGTNGFIAPEGPTSNRADIYSLGKLLYEIATGQDRLEFPQLPKQVSVDEGILLELNQVLLKACDPDPRNRHPSVQALRGELDFLIQGRSIWRVRQLERALRWTKASFATTFLLALAGFLWFQSHQARRSAAQTLLERRIGSIIYQGNERVKRGDYLGATHYFAKGALMDSSGSLEHRVRIGSALEYAARTIAEFKGDSDVACFLEGSETLASVVDGKVRLTDVIAQRVTREINTEASRLASDSSGRILAMANGSYVAMLDLTSGEQKTLTFPTNIWHISIAAADRFAITTVDGKVHLFPGDRIVSYEGRPLYKGILSPSGKLLCLLESKGRISVIDAETLQPLRFDVKHGPQPYYAAFFPDESRLITCSFDRSALCWDLQSGRTVGYPMEHENGILFASISPDGALVATTSMDKTVRVWQSSNFAPIRENHVLTHPETVVWAKFVGNRSILTHCEDGVTRLWSIESNRLLRKEEPYSFVIPPRHIYVDSGIQLTGINNRVEGVFRGMPLSFSVEAPVQAISVDPAQQLIAVGTRDNLRTPRSVRLFDGSGTPVGKPMFHKDGITYVTFSHSGELIGSCSEDFTARIWNRKGEPISAPLKHKDQVRWLCFNDTDEWVVTGSYDETVRLWNARSGTAVTVPLKIDNIVDYVSFRGDSELFIVNSLRNYTLPIPLFPGDVSMLFAKTPVPIDSEEF